MKYTIVESTDMDAFIDIINNKLTQGWKLQGGVSTGVYLITDRDGDKENNFWYSQAMISDKEDK